MTNTAIFAVGLFTFLLFSGGIAFTLIEVQRLGAEASEKTLLNAQTIPYR